MDQFLWNFGFKFNKFNFHCFKFYHRSKRFRIHWYINCSKIVFKIVVHRQALIIYRLRKKRLGLLSNKYGLKMTAKRVFEGLKDFLRPILMKYFEFLSSVAVFNRVEITLVWYPEVAAQNLNRVKLEMGYDPVFFNQISDFEIPPKEFKRIFKKI
jgi:hypothetical protein